MISLYLKSLNKKNRASHAKYDFRSFFKSALIWGIIFFSKCIDLILNLKHFEKLWNFFSKCVIFQSALKHWLLKLQCTCYVENDQVVLEIFFYYVQVKMNCCYLAVPDSSYLLVLWQFRSSPNSPFIQISDHLHKGIPMAVKDSSLVEIFKQEK